jgi:hypothetical protein
MVGLTGCSVAVDDQCKQWQAQGEIFSTMDNCVKCGNALGVEDLSAVRACAFKRDAAAILKP